MVAIVSPARRPARGAVNEGTADDLDALMQTQQVTTWTGWCC
jgi:hypothetical protein